MNVLSLFDGMGCGRLALDRAGIPVDKYYSSEIEKAPVAVVSHHYPDVIHMGDVTKWKEWDIEWDKIDLVIGGSPCQGFSFEGKQLNFDDPRSALFFVFAEIVDYVKELNPNMKFFLENVRMKQEHEDVITMRMGVVPIVVNSNLVSAQNRFRIYWSNIEGLHEPEDRGIFLKDILHENVDLSDYMISGRIGEWFKKDSDYVSGHTKVFDDASDKRAGTLTASQYSSWSGNFVFEALSGYVVSLDVARKHLEREVELGHIRKLSLPGNDGIYHVNDKKVALGEDGDYLFRCVGVSRDALWGEESRPRFTDGDKFYTLLASGGDDGIMMNGYIRRLTPVECERLQTVPDDYTRVQLNGKWLSDTQRYKMLGNGWTVDVIAHLFQGLRGRA